jgi:hypothetical protein
MRVKRGVVGCACSLTRSQVLQHDSVRQERALDSQGTLNVLAGARLRAKLYLLSYVGVGQGLVSVVFSADGYSVVAASWIAQV